MRMWKDETSYSQGTKKKIPRVVTLGLPYGVKLIVHRLVHSGDCWFYSIKWNGMFCVKDRELDAKKVEDAKKEAVEASGQVLTGWSSALHQAAEELVAMCLKGQGKVKAG